MRHWRVLATITLLLLAGNGFAQDDLQQGKIKKADAGKSALTLTVDGKDRDFLLTAETKIMNAAGAFVNDPFGDKVFAEGAAVVFRARLKDGKDVLLGVKLLGPKNAAKEPLDIRKGKILQIDLDKNLIKLLTADGKALELLMTEDSNLGVPGENLKERLQSYKVNAEISYVVKQKDGKDWLFGMRTGGGPVLKKFDSSKLLPLDELGDKEYLQGYKGGFYPGGKNQRPAEHEAAGLRLAREVQPRDADGKPDPQGKIVMLSVGMSNTAQASTGFQKVLRSAEGISPQFQFVNGAQGGQTAVLTQQDETGAGLKYWANVDQRFKEAGVTRAQVQVIWIKQADAGPTQGFPDHAKKLEEELARCVQLFPKRFPNAKLVYLTSRTYGGYARTPLNPEPYAYESGFSVKWLIERQIKGEAGLNYNAAKGEIKAPWLSWGPHFWANGSTKRAADGFCFEESDFAEDGTHHSAAGSEKLGRLMLRFFSTDATARSWFLK